MDRVKVRVLLLACAGHFEHAIAPFVLRRLNDLRVIRREHDLQRVPHRDQVDTLLSDLDCVFGYHAFQHVVVFDLVGPHGFVAKHEPAYGMVRVEFAGQLRALQQLESVRAERPDYRTA